MRSICVVIILLLSAFVSCRTEKKEQGILSRPQMVDWMMDIYLAEARLQNMQFVRDSAYKIFVPYQDSLMRRKGIQDSVLRKSYHYYMEHPGEMEAIYDTMIDSLGLREQRLQRTPLGKPVP